MGAAACFDCAAASTHAVGSHHCRDMVGAACPARCCLHHLNGATWYSLPAAAKWRSPPNRCSHRRCCSGSRAQPASQRPALTPSQRPQSSCRLRARQNGAPAHKRGLQAQTRRRAAPSGAPPARSAAALAARRRWPAASSQQLQLAAGLGCTAPRRPPAQQAGGMRPRRQLAATAACLPLRGGWGLVAAGVSPSAPPSWIHVSS